MSFLNKVIEFLKSPDGFEDEWLIHFDFSDANKEVSQKEIIGKINSTLNKVYEFLNFSVISGEFIDSIEEYKAEIKAIQDSISLIQSSIELKEDYFDSQEILVDSFLNSFALPLKNSLKDIDHLCVRYERKFLLNSTDEILFDAISKNSIFDNLKDLAKILRLNIKLTDIDRDLSVNKKLLSDLLITRKELEILIPKNNNTYISILYDKCNYLIRKVLYRFNQDKKTSYLYAFDYQDKELTFEDVKPGIFEIFDSVTMKHYSIGDNDYNFSDIDKIHEKKRKLIPLRCLEYHHLVKTYKDKNQNFKQVTNLYNEFVEICNSETTSSSITTYDIKSYYIIKNYIKNNKFSIQLESNLVNLAEAEKSLSEIKHLQQETRIRNYFPYFKICAFIDDLLQKTFKNSIDDYSEVSSIINKMELYLKEAFVNYEWCKDRNFMAFQLPKKECCIEHPELKVNIFLSSSFVLPLNYDKIELDLKEFKRRVDNYKTICEVHLNLKKEKDIILKLKSDMELSERKSIEILGIFSAIVLFTSGSIQIFSIDGMTVKDGLRFMLIFSYSIVLFVFLIWLISRDNLKNLTIIHKAFSVVLFVITIISFLYVLDIEIPISHNKKQTEIKSVQIPIKQTPEIKQRQ